MAKYFVDGQDLTDIANAIREKTGESANMEFPDEFVSEIESISTGGITPTGTKQITANGTGIDVAQYASADVAVPNTYAAADEGKVVSNGALVAQTSKNIGTNGTVDTTLNNQVVVAVPNSYSASDEGKVVSSGALVSQTSKNIGSNGTVDTTLNNQVVVSVPNSYSASDEGKVVSNGALVAQGSDTVTENDIYDTTLISSLTVNVPSSGGVQTGTFTISDADAATYKTSEYTVSSITCQNGYIIVAQRTSTNGQYWWIYCPIMTNSQYLNSTNLQGGVSLASHTNSNMAKLVNNHPVIKGTNASFPLVAGTYDVIYW